jgi:hypothetical protein
VNPQFAENPNQRLSDLRIERINDALNEKGNSSVGHMSYNNILVYFSQETALLHTPIMTIYQQNSNNALRNLMIVLRYYVLRLEMMVNQRKSELQFE